MVTDRTRPINETPSNVISRYNPFTGPEGSMRRRASIGIVLLALSHLGFANASSVLAQAGSIGGSIGKVDKSISGGDEVVRPRVAPQPKRPTAKPRESSGQSCGRIVGTWRWYLGMTQTVFNQNGTLRNTDGNTGRWACAGADVRAEWASGDTEHYTISSDGNSMLVVSTWRGGTSFTATRR